MGADFSVEHDKLSIFKLFFLRKLVSKVIHLFLQNFDQIKNLIRTE